MRQGKFNCRWRNRGVQKEIGRSGFHRWRRAATCAQSERNTTKLGDGQGDHGHCRNIAGKRVVLSEGRVG